jgi:hypothetical protein
MISDTKAKKGIYFQVLVLDQYLSDDVFNRYETVEQFKMGRSYLNFRIGVFSSYKDAGSERAYLRRMGVENVEILAFFNEQNLSLEDAALLSNNHIGHDAFLSIEGERIGMEQLNAILFEHDGNVPVEYKVELGAHLNPMSFNIEENQVQIEESETTTGFYTYRFGTFLSRAEAIEFRKKLIAEHGVEEAVLIPYYQGKRISHMLAENFERLNN